MQTNINNINNMEDYMLNTLNALMIDIRNNNIDMRTNIETPVFLRIKGSYASPGFMNPEGVVIWHKAAQCYFKKTIEKDNLKIDTKLDYEFDYQKSLTTKLDKLNS
jgi:hypothetical protein